MRSMINKSTTSIDILPNNRLLRATVDNRVNKETSYIFLEVNSFVPRIFSRAIFYLKYNFLPLATEKKTPLEVGK